MIGLIQREKNEEIAIPTGNAAPINSINRNFSRVNVNIISNPRKAEEIGRKNERADSMILGGSNG